MRTLIADHDFTRAKGIAEACIARGIVVEHASHGAAALQIALEHVPDLVICPLELPVIDAVRLTEILRANPCTRGARFLFLTTDELDASIVMDPRDVAVPSPWDVEEILRYVEPILSQNTRPGASRSNSEISGKLTQISLLDLLQIFQMNGKTGTLRVSNAGTRSAVVLVRQGQVIDASIPLADGTSIAREKALFRLLTWGEGSFEFLPGEPAGNARIQLPMRSVLLEGMRQKDELATRRGDLPADISRLRVVARSEDVRSWTHPGIREVVEAVDTYERVSDIVDHCRMPDYQVLCALSELLARGVLAVERPGGLPEHELASGDRSILTALELRQLREWASASRLTSGPVVKVVVLAGEQARLDAFRRALAESGDFLPDPRMAREPRRAGSLGHFRLGDQLSLRLIAVRSAPIHAPLWEVVTYGMLGAIVLLPEQGPGLAPEAELGFAELAERAGARVLGLVQSDSGAALPQLQGAAGDAALVLPRTPASARLEVLRLLFARLLP